MGTLETASHPRLLANAAKHSAFTRWTELDLFGIVDARIAIGEGQLFKTFDAEFKKEKCKSAATKKHEP